MREKFILGGNFIFSFLYAQQAIESGAYFTTFLNF